MDYEIYKDHYQFEWDHRSHLTATLNIPIAVATVMGGALIALFQKFPFTNDITTYLFVFFSLFSVGGLITSIAFLFKAVHGYRYQRIPTPMQLKTHFDDLIAWWSRNDGSEENAKKDLNDFIKLRMAEAVEKNAVNNKNKSAYIYKTNAALIVSLIFIALCTIPYLVKTTSDSSDRIKVEIVNSGLTLIQKESNDMAENNQEQPANEQPNNDPKPVGPSNQEIREDKVVTTAEESSKSND